MPPIILTVLKVTFLLLLYFFVYRAVRTIAADLSGKRRSAEPAAPREPRATRAPRRTRGGTPTKLVVLDQNGSRLSSHRLDGTLRIGRDRACEITLDDTYVSQEHARIGERNGSWVVEDLGSTNGTYLNRQKVTVPTEISPGDRIRIGNTFLEVRR
ncbi:MAG TPA: FHA domain-containing protein [Actinomycetota bacterium]|nr:FHA domain-containing protein [Actinomycetota bacterium]